MFFEVMPMWNVTGLSGSVFKGSSFTTGCRPPSTTSLLLLLLLPPLLAFSAEQRPYELFFFKNLTCEIYKFRIVQSKSGVCKALEKPNIIMAGRTRLGKLKSKWLTTNDTMISKTLNGIRRWMDTMQVD